MISKHLNEKTLKGLNQAGDVYCPGGDGFPSFSQGGFARHIDEILDYLPPTDLADLLGLLGLFAWLPTFLIRAMAWLAHHNRFFPGPLGAALRLLDFGLKGVFYTLYYSEESIFPLIHWDAKTVA